MAKKCTCQVIKKCYGDPNVANQDVRYEIEYCSLHVAAPALLKALKVANEWLSDDDPNWYPKKTVVKALAKVRIK